MSLLNFPEKPDVSAMSFVPQMDKPSSTIAENIAAGFKQGRALAPLNSRLYERNWWTDTINQIADQTGQNYFQKFTNPAYTFQTGTAEYFYHANNIRNFVKKNQNTLKLGDPAEQTNLNMLLLDKDEFARQISKQAKENALADVEEANQIYEQSNTNAAKAGFFVGELGAGFTDPLNLGLAVTTGPLGVGRTLASVMLREALINMSAEAIQAPAVADWYKTLGLDYGFEEFRNSLIAAGTFGAAFPLAIRAGEKAVLLTVDQLRKGADVIFDGGTAKSDVAQGAEFTLDVLDADAVENPLDGPKADIEHVKRLEAAQSAIIDATAPNITEQPKSAIRASDTVYDADNLDNQVFRFDPDEILVDAKLFQFKEGGDQFGVTNRLQGVTKWDPGKAGQIVVYEFSDGRQFIADGHQRLGLAKRIKLEDPSQDVRLYGRKIKEVDGITPDEAVVIAAMKNIAEGTGTKTDAAKVFRIAPDKVNDPSFPKTGAFIQHARSLSNLSNESFGLIKNGIVSEEFGALVGRLVPDDPDMQLAALNVLARVDPSNVFQADTIVRQVMESGVTKETQESLFGDEAIVESLFLERARVLDQAVKKLKKDKSAFNNITSNAAKLEGEGNKLATDANRKRVQTDGEAIAIIQSQANKKGFLSDALSDAARFARQSGNYGQASNSFVEAVRRSIDQGDFRRAETGDVRRFVNDQTQEFAARNQPAQDQLDKFDNPHSDAVIAQGDAMVEDIKADAQQSRDLFDQGQASQAGNRQMDLEELIDEAKDDLSNTLDIDTFRSEINQDDLFPVGFVEGEDGQPTARLATAKQLLDEIDQDDAMIDRLSRCPI
jgi:dephospho-CoA kinase